MSNQIKALLLIAFFLLTLIVSCNKEEAIPTSNTCFLLIQYEEDADGDTREYIYEYGNELLTSSSTNLTYVDPARDSYIYTYQHFYNANNQIEKTLWTLDESRSYTFYRFYNAKGFVIEYTAESNVRDYRYKYTYAYNSDNQRIVRKRYVYDTSTNSYTLYSIRKYYYQGSENHNPIATIDYDENGDETRRWESTYDGKVYPFTTNQHVFGLSGLTNNRLTDHYFSEGVLRAKYENSYQYNNLNYPTSAHVAITNYDENGITVSTDSRETTYTYDCH